MRKGKCCRNFILPFSIHQLRRAYTAWRNQQNYYMWRGKKLGIPRDVHLIYPMVIPLFGGRKQNWEPQQKRVCNGIYHYTCKHFDKKTSNCTIYESRPQVCVDYPYGRPCNYKNCNCSFKSGQTTNQFS